MDKKVPMALDENVVSPEMTQSTVRFPDQPVRINEWEQFEEICRQVAVIVDEWRFNRDAANQR